MSKDVLIEKAPLSDDEKLEQETIQAVEEGFGASIDFQKVRAEDIITLTARLAQVMAEEADYLEKMQVEKIAPLQKEKVMLTNALALIKKKIPKEGAFMDALSEQEREDLREVVMVFNEVLEENYARVNTARLVNQRIVEAITDVVKERSNQESYDGQGATSGSSGESAPLSINAKV